MNCGDFAQLLPLYLSEELAAAQAGEFAAHRVRCHSCARLLNESMKLDAELKAAVLAEPVVTSGLERRVHREIAREAAARSRIFWRWGAGLGVAAAAVMVFLAVPRKSVGLMAAAASDHRIEVVNHQLRRWKSGIGDAEQLAASRGIPGTLIAALADRGYRFKEARLCRLDGYVFLHLVYLDGSGEFSVFLRNEDGGTIAGALRETVAGKPVYSGENVAGFTDGRLKALIVTPNSSALQRIAREAAFAL